jgi:hypothetical protein
MAKEAPANLKKGKLTTEAKPAATNPATTKFTKKGVPTLVLSMAAA